MFALNQYFPSIANNKKRIMQTQKEKQHGQMQVKLDRQDIESSEENLP